MGDLEKATLIAAVLERAAEQLGDVTPRAVELCYARHPETRSLFRTLDPQSPARLEGAMVEQSLYCLMYWTDSPGEVEIVLMTTLPHHIETVGVSADLFTQLFIAVCDVIAGTIPQGEMVQRQAWEEQRAELLALMDSSAAYARPRPVTNPC
jgi:hypothetical protein